MSPPRKQPRRDWSGTDDETVEMQTDKSLDPTTSASVQQSDPDSQMHDDDSSETSTSCERPERWQCVFLQYLNMHDDHSLDPDADFQDLLDSSSDDYISSGEEYTTSEDKERKAANAELTPTQDHASNRNYCFVCKTPQSKIARHFKVHKQEEPEIAKALSLRKGSKNRKIMLEKLRNKGNFLHNNEVMSQGSGALKLKRKSQTSRDSTKYVFCVYCNGMFVRKDLWRHARRCNYKPDSDEETLGKKRILGLAAYSSVTQSISEGVSRMLRNMNQDEVTAVVRDDYCILQFAQSLFSKHGHDTTKYEYIRQKLREMGRLVITLRNKASIHSLQDAIKPDNFEKVISSVKETAGYDQESNSYTSPSLAMKLGHSLHKVCNIVHRRALMSDDDDLKKSAKAFEKLLRSKWAENICTRALTTLQEMKFNQPSTLPLIEDMQKLHKHLDHKAQHATSEFKKSPSPAAYAELAKVTLTQVILFNRRHAGQVSKMSLKNFLDRDQAKVHDDVAQGLTAFEQKLSQLFSRVELRGKRGRSVAVLLTPDMVQALTLLVGKREECCVPQQNISLFAVPKCLSHYRGQDCLRHFASDCGTKHPEHLRSAQLRKQVATVSQILNLKNNELDQLADFMGHDIGVHREYYHLPESATQVAKISKLLIAMERGPLPKPEGESLDQIPDDLSDGDDGCVAKSLDGVSDAMGLPCSSEIGHGPEPTTVKESSPGDGVPETSKMRRKVVRRSWTQEEVAAVLRHFQPHILKGRLASILECEQCKKTEHPVLEERTIQNIRDFVRNKGSALKKQNHS